MIIDEIKKGNIEAIKSKNINARNIYGIVINKFMLLSVKKRETNEVVSDVEMTNILQKTIKELEDEMENYKKVNNTTEVQNIEEQKSVISKYLPKMLSEEEIKNIIDKLDDKSIPSVMKHFKLNYAGEVDMGKVGIVLKRIN